MPRIGLTLSACMLLLLGVLAPAPWTIGACGFVCGMGFGTVMPTGRSHPDACGPPATWRRCCHRLTVAQPWRRPGNRGFGALVFGLLKGIDITESARTGHAATVLRAFQVGFIATAGVALAGAACALRLPRLRL